MSDIDKQEIYNKYIIVAIPIFIINMGDYLDYKLLVRKDIFWII